MHPYALIKEERKKIEIWWDFCFVVSNVLRVVVKFELSASFLLGKFSIN
jgi:hypothetical protein